MIPRVLALLALVSWLRVGASAQSVNAAVEATALDAADQLFASGKVAEAVTRYRAVANADPQSVQAQVGLIRSYLVLEKLDEAKAAAETALVSVPNSPLLLTTVGDLQFRMGRIPEAERSYIKAENLKPDEVTPYLGLARVYRAYSLYRRAYDSMNRAHELAPNDIAVQLLYFNALPQQDRIPALEGYLASPTGKNSPIANKLSQYLVFLQKNAAAPSHPCKVVSNVQETTAKLYPIARAGMQLGAAGLAVKINKQELHLALDTGAAGILLGHTAAEKAGLQRLGYQPIVGVGDSGQQGGYTAAVDRIRVGDLEFQNCVVRVTDAATPVTGQDGLIGSNVFVSYLVDIDIPSAKLRLSSLPKRPDQPAAPPAFLKTQSQDSQELEAESVPGEANQSAGKASAFALPKDAYVAPEMAKWTKVYRFRSLLLIPTKVDDAGPMLFMIDTGSFSNVLSPRAAREVTQVRADPAMKVSGLSGSVSRVYRADKANLNFGRYAQQNQDIVTFDLSSASKQTGTEVSGILGFAMLRILDIKIDYRDGLVDFYYDPNHLPKGLRIQK